MVRIGPSYAGPVPGPPESFGAFARDRDLADASGHRVEALTPLLALAEGIPLEPAVSGPLAGGRDGILGRLRYGGGHAIGAESDVDFEFLVAITRVPESEPFVPRLFCRRRGRVEFAAAMGFELDDEAAWTESEALAARYDVATSPYQDVNWIRQLLSPKFIDWLATEPPPGFAFELAYGDLAGSVEAGDCSVDRLAAVWDATGAVAERIAAECAEEA
jgi:hypothetical protein